MSDPTLAEKDPATVLAQALADYKAATVSAANPTGTTLAPADPRRLHLQALLALLAQQRSLIDFSGKQSLLRFVSDEWIDELALLWNETRLPAKPSTCMQRFNFPDDSALHSVLAGTRVTDGINTWATLVDASSTSAIVSATVQCIVDGSATNSVAMGQITTLVDPAHAVGCTSVTNTTETDGGRDLETVDEFRTRLRDAPENTSVGGPRLAYQQNALNASATVADAVALGPDDDGEVAFYPPAAGQVFVLIIKGTRDASGTLTAVVPDPDVELIATVETALSADDVRPLCDQVIVQAPAWHDFDTIVSFSIATSRSDSVATITTDVEQALTDWLLWQQSKIGRDLNPSELIKRMMNAGAKRVDVTEPAFTSLLRDQCARSSGYVLLGYGGVEDD